MIDVHLPAADGNHIVQSRYVEPEADAARLLAELKLRLPAQPRPKVCATRKVTL